MRGTWEKPARLSVLRSKGGGVFEDVTIATSLAEPISTESAGWGDYDNDGKADRFVCGEYTGKTADARCRSRLYHNQGNGTFVNVMDKAGVTNEHWSEGCAWGRF
jgi:enediyne biosynthesis protein E4